MLIHVLDAVIALLTVIAVCTSGCLPVIIPFYPYSSLLLSLKDGADKRTDVPDKPAACGTVGPDPPLPLEEQEDGRADETTHSSGEDK